MTDTTSEETLAASGEQTEESSSGYGNEAVSDGDGPSHDEISRRAHEISLGDEAGTDEENWHRAERELRAGPLEPWEKDTLGPKD